MPFGQNVTLPILAAEDLAVFKVVFDRWRDWTDIEEMLTRNVAARATVRRVLRRDQRGGTPRFEEPKTARSRRTVPLSPSVVRALRGQPVVQAKEKLAAGAVYTDHGLVFASLTDGPLDEHNIVHRHVKPAAKRAKLPDATRLYDLRHAHVTLSLRAREPVHVVSARVGHASARMTLDVYAHAMPADESEAPNRLEAVLFGRGE